MDELELSGRRHISTRRAGKEHGYHSDYIGQLIRGKKVAGQKVGRSWYVDEASLREYLGKEGSPAPKPTDSGYADSPAEESAEVLVSSNSQPPSSVVSAAVMEDVPLEEKIEIKKPVAEVIETKKEPPREEERTVIIQTPPVPKPIVQSSGLTYLSDDEPLLPHVAPVRTMRDDMPQMYDEPHEYEAMHSEPSALPRAALLVVLGLVALGAGTVLSSYIAWTSVVQESVPAAAFYTLW